MSGFFGLYIGCVSCFSEVDVSINGALVRQKFSTCGSNQNVGGSKLPPGMATIPWKTFSLKKMVEPQFLQKFNVTTLPVSVLLSYLDSSPDVKVTLSSGNQTYVPKALPVYVWQYLQWHMIALGESPSVWYRLFPQRHPPVLNISSVILFPFWLFNKL